MSNPGAFFPDPCSLSKTSTSVPSGSTVITLPMLNKRLLGRKMALAGSQVWPPSVVLEKMMSPRKAHECWALNPARSLGWRDRSHTA